jgi:hypothetical protein
MPTKCDTLYHWSTVTQKTYKVGVVKAAESRDCSRWKALTLFSNNPSNYAVGLTNA